MLALLLFLAHVPKNRLIFFTFALFGILSGLAAALYGHGDGQAIFNALGVSLGDGLHEYASEYFNGSNFTFASSSVPWILKTPQIVLFTSAVSSSLIGLVIQLIYNLAKRPPAVRHAATLITSVSLIALLCISTGVVYASQSERQRVGPTQPSAIPVMQVYLPGEEAPQIPEWDTETTYRVESLSVSSPNANSVEVTAGVINIGDVAGMVEVEVVVDGKVLNSSEVALQPGESGQVRFFVRFPLSGVFNITVGSLSKTVEIQG